MGATNYKFIGEYLKNKLNKTQKKSSKKFIKKLSLNSLSNDHTNESFNKYNFNFFQPKLYLKHQLLSSEFRSVNFFDQYIYDFSF